MDNTPPLHSIGFNDFMQIKENRSVEKHDGFALEFERRWRLKSLVFRRT